MRRVLSLIAAGTVVLAACSDTPIASPDPVDGPAFSAGQAPVYLVTFTEDVSDVAGTASEMARTHGFAVRYVRAFAARGFSAVIPASRLAAVQADPRVRLLEPDGPVHLVEPVVEKRPPGAGGGGNGGGGGGQVVPWGVTRVGGAGNGAGGTAWILDTGVDLDHPELNVDVSCSVSFVSNSADDKNGHGTHVAGTIAAIDNNSGVVGVAAGARICAVQVLGASGSGSWEGVVNGVNWAAAHAGNNDVANLSLGAAGSNGTLEQAIRDAAETGLRFTISAGNSGANAANYTPARVNHRNVYTVSAIASTDCMPSWSNWGNPPVDFAAPGSGVLSTWKGGGTKTLSGTSMAAPHVAGLVLLGAVSSNGTACNDPDGNPDPIAHR